MIFYRFFIIIVIIIFGILNIYRLSHRESGILNDAHRRVAQYRHGDPLRSDDVTDKSPEPLSNSVRVTAPLNRSYIRLYLYLYTRVILCKITDTIWPLKRSAITSVCVRRVRHSLFCSETRVSDCFAESRSVT